MPRARETRLALPLPTEKNIYFPLYRAQKVERSSLPPDRIVE